MSSKFSILKHEKMVGHSSCWINFSLNEKKNGKKFTTELSMKQSTRGFGLDGKSCWPGLDIKIPLTMNNNKIGEARDDQYLYNMDRIE